MYTRSKRKQYDLLCRKVGTVLFFCIASMIAPWLNVVYHFHSLLRVHRALSHHYKSYLGIICRFAIRTSSPHLSSFRSFEKPYSLRFPSSLPSFSPSPFPVLVLFSVPFPSFIPSSTVLSYCLVAGMAGKMPLAIASRSHGMQVAGEAYGPVVSCSALSLSMFCSAHAIAPSTTILTL
jgi:hypothetical protein